MTSGFYMSNQKGHFQPNIVAYYYKEWKDFQMPFHAHQAIEIMYVMTGECHIEIENEKIFMKKGHFVMIDANVPHRLIVKKSPTCRMLNVEFVLQPKEGIFPSIQEIAKRDPDLWSFLQTQKRFITLKDTQGLYYVLKSLVIELSEFKNEPSQIMIQTLLTNILLLIARMAVMKQEQLAKQTDLYIQTVIEYLHHNYDLDLKVSDLAAVVHLHPNYLQRIFKEKMNSTLMEYLTELRMEKAKMLLSKTTIPITEISDFVGINSRQYFSYLFKKSIGQTPQNYRRQQYEFYKS